jgi:hypothetical protein
MVLWPILVFLIVTAWSLKQLPVGLGPLFGMAFYQTLAVLSF